MEFGSQIDKQAISAHFPYAKFEERDFRELMLNISYSVEIHLCKDPEPCIDAIESLVLQRVWLSRNKTAGDYKLLHKRKPPDEDAFSPKGFNFADDKANGLAVLALLALKAAFDHAREFEREGLLFFSETTALREHGVWSGHRDCELDRLITRIKNNAIQKDDIKMGRRNRKLNELRSRIENDACKKTDAKTETKVKPKPPAIPLVDQFLLYPEEIHNMVFWVGSNKKLDNKQLIPEKAWVLNTYPELIKIYTHDRSELCGRTLLKVLNAFFPKGTVRTAEEIDQYEAIAQNHEIPYFQAVPLADPETERSQRSQELRQYLDKLKLYKDETPPEIVDFEHVFVCHPKSEFIGRETIKKRLDDFVQQGKPKAKYFLLIGDAGVGKTALISNYLADRRNQYVHYFIEYRRDELDSPAKFFTHLYYSLSKKHGLKTQPVTSDPGVVIEILKRRIREISDTRLSEGQREIIFIDGLDEATSSTVTGRTIADLIDFDLPKNFALVISSRLIPQLERFIHPSHDNVLYITSGSKANLTDMRKYLTARLQEKTHVPNVIDELTSKSNGNFRYATLIVPMILEKGAQLDKILRKIPKGLDGLYQFRIDSIEEKVRNQNRIAQLRKVMRMISILVEPHTPKEICSYLEIDYWDIRSSFGMLEQFFDLSCYNKQRKCRWSDLSFQEFILDSTRTSKTEIRGIHLAIAEQTIWAIHDKELPDARRYCVIYFAHHYSKATNIRHMLEYARSNLLPVICELSDPVNCEEVLRSFAIFTLIDASPAEVVFFWLLYWARCYVDEGGVDSALVLRKINARWLRRRSSKFDSFKDPYSLSDACIRALANEQIEPAFAVGIAVTLAAMLRDKFVDLTATCKVCEELIFGPARNTQEN